MQQGSLFDDIPEARFFGAVWQSAAKRAKKRLPFQLNGESKEEYDENLRDETRLEFVEALRLIADDIERKTLARQIRRIEVLWEKAEAIE